jgi:hypothetical protein
MCLNTKGKPMATKSEINLQQFCEQDPDRYHKSLLNPFVADGKKYATDSRILIEIDAAGEPDTSRTGIRYADPPDAKCIFDSFWISDAVFSAWPSEQPIMGKIDCPKCENVNCEECDGFGSFECDLGHDHDCEKCDGEGVVMNPKCVCKGTGMIPGPVRQQIDNKQINIKYYRMIRELPGPVEYAMNDDVVLFRFYGGRGIVKTFSDILESE